MDFLVGRLKYGYDQTENKTKKEHFKMPPLNENQIFDLSMFDSRGIYQINICINIREDSQIPCKFSKYRVDIRK